jgi:hypothetical protein
VMKGSRAKKRQQATSAANAGWSMVQQPPLSLPLSLRPGALAHHTRQHRGPATVPSPAVQPQLQLARAASQCSPQAGLLGARLLPRGPAQGAPGGVHCPMHSRLLEWPCRGRPQV